VLTLLTVLDAAVAFILVLGAIGWIGSIEWVAFAMFMSEWVATCLRFIVVRRQLSISSMQLASTILPSLLASFGMAACVSLFRDFSQVGPVLELIACVLVGCVSYCVLLLGLDGSFRKDLVNLRSGVLQ
jgi:hypothetical protein